LPGTTLNGNEIRPRTGAQILAHLATPLNVTVLRELQTGPKRPDELRRECSPPSKRALRSCLATLERLGVVTRRGHRLLPESREYDLAEPGRELRFVMIALERWLKSNRPDRIELDTDAGAHAIKTVLSGWSANIMRAVAARPYTLAELNDLIEPLARDSLEHRVEAMHRAGLLELTDRGVGEKRPYVRTAWLCRAMGPIVAASRWERRNLPEMSALIGRSDAETALLLTMPLLQLPPTARGSCRLIVEISEEPGEMDATVTATAEGCRVTHYEPVNRDADATASGPPSAWFRAAIEAKLGHLEVDGDQRLANGLLNALFAALYSLRAPSISYKL
jgi:DNA-binding HxlR family transcriptional regulator